LHRLGSLENRLLIQGQPAGEQRGSLGGDLPGPRRWNRSKTAHLKPLWGLETSGDRKERQRRHLRLDCEPDRWQRRRFDGIFKVNPDGTGLLQLTSGPSGRDSVQPRVDDSGTWVAFTTNANPGWRPGRARRGDLPDSHGRDRAPARDIWPWW